MTEIDKLKELIAEINMGNVAQMFTLGELSSGLRGWREEAYEAVIGIETEIAALQRRVADADKVEADG